MAVHSFYKSSNDDFLIAKGDSFLLLKDFSFKFDMIFADPPYFLSNGGISFQSGKVVCVDKGDWDKGKTPEEMNDFNMEWLRLCRDKLKDNGSIWISGTYHNIFSVADCLTKLGFKILNVITWQKTNPPVNISCRFFTHSTEFIIWARKCMKVPHKYNYNLMKQLNDGKQMTDVWRLPAIGRWEKSCGKHPTQKPLSVLTRIILASTDKGDWILDPFSGSSTTGIAANLCGRRFAGIEQLEEFCLMSKARREELDNEESRTFLKRHIADLEHLESEQQLQMYAHETIIDNTLPFETKPMETIDEGKVFITCYVRKSDPELESFLNHSATCHRTKHISEAKLSKAEYLFPMVKGSVDGYYKIESIDTTNKEVRFILGEYTPLTNKWIHIYNRMKPGEILGYEACLKLCGIDI